MRLTIGCMLLVLSIGSRATAQVIRPMLIPGGGLYAEPQEVVVASSVGSTIYYTLDGTEPGPGKASISTGETVLVNHPSTLRVVAYKPDCQPSVIKSADYSFRDPVVWHVKTDGNDANDGLSWETAKQTIQAAMEAAIGGDDIWVSAGAYLGPVTVKHGVKLLGGFNGYESIREQRDTKANQTVIHGNPTGRPVVSITYATSKTLIDGFVISNGVDAYGRGIECFLASPTIRNNVITGNGSTGIYGHGSPSQIIIRNDLIVRNGRSFIGIYLREMSSSYPWETRGTGLIINNTVIGPHWSGISAFMAETVVANNIVAFNRAGIGGDSRSLLATNCVFGNTWGYGDFDGALLPNHPTDINVDPLFRDMANGDYRLRWDSPCIDAGTNEGAPTTDILGSMRPMDGNHDGVAVTDIGAYEAPMPVGIDILSDAVRLQPRKLIQVAILSDAVFNALLADPATVVFGPGNAKEIHGQGHQEDVNGDGLTDLLFHFSCAESGITPGYQTVTLSGKLLTGEDIIGWDGVTGISK